MVLDAETGTAVSCWHQSDTLCRDICAAFYIDRDGGEDCVSCAALPRSPYFGILLEEKK